MYLLGCIELDECLEIFNLENITLRFLLETMEILLFKEPPLDEAHVQVDIEAKLGGFKLL